MDEALTPSAGDRLSSCELVETEGHARSREVLGHTKFKFCFWNLLEFFLFPLEHFLSEVFRSADVDLQAGPTVPLRVFEDVGQAWEPGG